MTLRSINRPVPFAGSGKRHPLRCLFFAIRFLLPAGCLVLTPSALADHSGADCPTNQVSNETYTTFDVARITDGDTLVLEDNRRVRIIGLNTLELRAAHPDDKRWARIASLALDDSIGDKSVTLIEGRDSLDRHGRTLGHIVNTAGDNVALQLIDSGLGIAVAIGRNTQCAEQMLRHEIAARQARRGIWHSPGPWFVNDARLAGNERGFHVLQSTVERVTGSRRSPSLMLANGLSVKLGKHWPKDTSPLNPVSVADLPGKRVEVRGWLSSSSGRVSLSLHHPANLTVLGN